MDRGLYCDRHTYVNIHINADHSPDLATQEEENIHAKAYGNPPAYGNGGTVPDCHPVTHDSTDRHGRGENRGDEYTRGN